MTIVSLETVRLQARAHDKLDAIRQAGELLIQGGCVEPPYVNGMLAREQTMSTYLGNGVSIPHGNLAEIIEDPDAAEQFARTTDPLLIIERLNRTRVEEA